MKSCVVLAWERWVVMAEGAQHIKQERTEILCLVMERWRKILHESRSTRWTVLVRLREVCHLDCLISCAKQRLVKSQV
jgi:hypothetical protein